MATIDLTTSTFDEVVTKDGIVLVDFWAEWCGPCKNFAPIFEASSETKTDIVHAKVDTEAQQELGMKFGVTAIPTLMAFRDGIMVFNQAGALPAPALQQLVDAVEALDMDDVRAKIAEHEAAEH
ncbi:MAG: thioredoxin [Demequina sp.]|uniref:thioredoxin n=1 Tax=Demequina sp. TaxID=2050685 RepID=UPI00198E6501|nr:thioredoxin [Demequina sp.]MBC7297647.1 thioredoxin [Demequina sp.]